MQGSECPHSSSSVCCCGSFSKKRKFFFVLLHCPSLPPLFCGETSHRASSLCLCAPGHYTGRTAALLTTGLCGQREPVSYNLTQSYTLMPNPLFSVTIRRLYYNGEDVAVMLMLGWILQMVAPQVLGSVASIFAGF